MQIGKDFVYDENIKHQFLGLRKYLINKLSPECRIARSVQYK